jgi:hypothetical protein
MNAEINGQTFKKQQDISYPPSISPKHFIIYEVKNSNFISAET